MIDGQQVERIVSTPRQQPSTVRSELSTQVLGIQADLEHRSPLSSGDHVEAFRRIADQQPSAVGADRTDELQVQAGHRRREGRSAGPTPYRNPLDPSVDSHPEQVAQFRIEEACRVGNRTHGPSPRLGYIESRGRTPRGFLGCQFGHQQGTGHQLPEFWLPGAQGNGLAQRGQQSAQVLRLMRAYREAQPSVVQRTVALPPPTYLLD